MDATRWEYRVEDRDKFKGAERARILNDLGNEGWEMCGFSDNGGWNFTMVFKRPRPDVPSRPLEDLDD